MELDYGCMYIYIYIHFSVNVILCCSVFVCVCVCDCCLQPINVQKIPWRMPVFTQLLPSHTTILHFPGSPRRGDKLLANAVCVEVVYTISWLIPRKLPSVHPFSLTPSQKHLKCGIDFSVTHDKGSDNRP